MRTQGDLEARLEACPNVRRVWTANQLATSTADLRAAEPGSDAWSEALYRNAFDPERSPDVLVQWQPLFLPLLGWQTNHGSPYAYDTHVPLLILAPGVAPREVDDRVLTVDLAPTLATLLDVPVPERDRRHRAHGAAHRQVIGHRVLGLGGGAAGPPRRRLAPNPPWVENGLAAVRRDAAAEGSSRRGVTP